jgi:uncharacterized protein YcbX
VDRVAHVVQLRTYPIKGCAPVTLQQSSVTFAGLRHDRTFLVIDNDGQFRSQRRDFRLSVIRPELDPDGRQLTLHADDVPALGPVAVDLTSARRAIWLFGQPYQGIDQGEAVAAWLTTVLGVPSRLVRVPPEHRRVTDGETPGTSAYADSSAILITSEPSLARLNTTIAARGGREVPMDRFRPNIVIAGWPDPHVEDHVREARIGTAGLGFTKLAIRCSVTLVDQPTGRRAGPEPLRTLAGYRRAPDGGVAFGAKFSVTEPGQISVGDEVRVERWSS